MPDYQVIARKFRPQLFKEVIGQDAIVATLKNAIKFNRLAQAYLFCGSRGTGKTTLARILSKALNCENLNNECEPCNQCTSCRETTSGHSLNVLEIDGASHRGIEDIRQINETVGYTPASGRYKIYIIDEVHMLTKEAFNALLKTLEEPPPKVKFFFATTEPHKVLPTILSRCQRFNLSRIPLEKIVAKLKLISQQIGAEVEEDALFLLAQQAEGGLRDAESLFDQILTFETGHITIHSVNSILGLAPKDLYFELDSAGKEGHLAKAFEMAHEVFSQGKDLIHFIEGLIEHLRTIMLVKLAGVSTPLLTLSAQDKKRYELHAHFYNQEQCLNLIEYLVNASHQIRFAPSSRIALETILLHVLRSHFQIPVEVLVRRLSELEQTITLAPNKEQTVSAVKPTTSLAQGIPIAGTPITKLPIKPLESISEDPTPTSADLGFKKKQPLAEIKKPIVATPAPIPSTSIEPLKKSAHHYDTLFHFAAVELEGKIQKLH